MGDPDQPRWWDFIGHRRRYVSDLTWFGLAAAIIGITVVTQSPGWTRLLGLLPVGVGVGMLGGALLRRIRSGS
jgi:hypothetical protein